MAADELRRHCTELTRRQKAAILLMQLGKERAAKVLRTLREHEVEEIMAEIARLHDVDASEIAEEVLNEFRITRRGQRYVAAGRHRRSPASCSRRASAAGKADEILDRLSVTLVELPVRVPAPRRPPPGAHLPRRTSTRRRSRSCSRTCSPEQARMVLSGAARGAAARRRPCASR